MLAIFFSLALVSTRMRQLITIIFGFLLYSTETFIKWHRFTIIITTLGTSPHINLKLNDINLLIHGLLLIIIHYPLFGTA